MAAFTGVVKFFNQDKGFGFVKQDDGPDVFLHARDLRESGVEGPVDKDDQLAFEVTQGDRGPRAVNISRL